MDGQDGQPIAGDTAARPGGFRKVLKRIRGVFIPRSSNKAPKPSYGQTAGQVSGRRELRSPSPILQLPEIQQQGHFGNELQQDVSIGERLHQQATLSSPSLAEGSVHSSTLPIRPPLPIPAVSEGNLFTCPETHLSIPSSLPTSRTASVAVGQPISHGSTRDIPEIILPTKKSRAQALFGRYGLEVDPEGHFAEDAPDEGSRFARRVTKPAKVRVHHHCHRCTMAIGSNGICIACGHRRCWRCDRWPHHRPESGSRSSQDTGRSRRSIPSPRLSPTRTETLDVWLANPRARPQTSRTLSSIFTRGDVFSTRHVRRLCHQCHSPFIWTETRCQDCNHRLCKECPRDPPPSPPRSGSTRISLSPLPPPQSHVRERVMKKPRVRVRYTCELCQTVFEEGNRRCSNCGHARCHSCSRYPPRTDSQRGPNPAAIDAFRDRMETMP